MIVVSFRAIASVSTCMTVIWTDKILHIPTDGYFNQWSGGRWFCRSVDAHLCTAVSVAKPFLSFDHQFVKDRCFLLVCYVQCSVMKPWLLATERTALRIITVVVIGKTNYKGKWINSAVGFSFLFFNSNILVEDHCVTKIPLLPLICDLLLFWLKLIAKTLVTHLFIFLRSRVSVMTHFKIKYIFLLLWLFIFVHGASWAVKWGLKGTQALCHGKPNNRFD